MTPLEKWEAQGRRCLYCQEPHDFYALTKDHFYATAKIRQLSAQGKRKILRHRNTVLACKACNLSKGERLPTKAEVDRFIAVYGQLPYRGTESPFERENLPAGSGKARRWCGKLMQPPEVDLWDGAIE